MEISLSNSSSSFYILETESHRWAVTCAKATISDKVTRAEPRIPDSESVLKPDLGACDLLKKATAYRPFYPKGNLQVSLEAFLDLMTTFFSDFAKPQKDVWPAETARIPSILRERFRIGSCAEYQMYFCKMPTSMSDSNLREMLTSMSNSNLCEMPRSMSDSNLREMSTSVYNSKLCEMPSSVPDEDLCELCNSLPDPSEVPSSKPDDLHEISSSLPDVCEVPCSMPDDLCEIPSPLPDPDILCSDPCSFPNLLHSGSYKRLSHLMLCPWSMLCSLFHQLLLSGSPDLRGKSSETLDTTTPGLQLRIIWLLWGFWMLWLWVLQLWMLQLWMLRLWVLLSRNYSHEVPRSCMLWLRRWLRLLNTEEQLCSRTYHPALPSGRLPSFCSPPCIQISLLHLPTLLRY